MCRPHEDHAVRSDDHVCSVAVVAVGADVEAAAARAVRAAAVDAQQSGEERRQRRDRPVALAAGLAVLDDAQRELEEFA